MKKIILVSSCLLLSLILWMGNSTAKPVDTLTAKTVATHFLAGRNVELPRSAQQARIAYIGHSFDENSQRSVPCYYIVNLNQGFVILSADNRIEPILGYSTEGNFNTEDIPDNMLSFLDGYSAQIKAFLHDTSSTPNEATAKWTSLIRDDYTPNSTKGAVVGPLLTTIWNQNDIYNAYCPTDANGPGGHAYAGCVATAMAQIIRYWEYPTQGTGNHAYTCNSSMYVNGQLTNFNYGTLQVNFGIQYNYSNMPDIITSTNYTDVAKLIYYCGVSVDMEYTPCGSSAYSSDVPNALKQYFKYSNSYGTPTPQYKNRSSYSESDWINLLKSELNNWRPVLYNGSGSGGGHAFVCDGYDDQGYFHFNWGWSGSYNGYFILTALNPGTHIFNDYQGAVINVQGLTPLIKTNSNQLSFLCAAGSVSEAKSLAIHGIALTNNIVITAPADFEISTDGTSYSSSLNVSNTISGIYVRYTPSSSGQATDHGTLTLTSGGTTRTVALSGHTYVLDCNAPQNVQYTADNNGNVQLSWNAPSQDIHSYRFSIDSTFYNSWRLGASNYLLAQRACDSDLVAYHQKRVTQVSFYIPNGVATYSSDRKIVIYQGGSIINNALNEGTLIREQAVSSFVTGWNTVTLNNPVTIDAHQELWYGVQFNSTSSTTFPVPVGTKVGVAGKGDLVKEDGTWTLLSNRGINRNIPIKITIQDSPSSITNYTIEQNDNIVGTVTSTQYNDHVTTSGSYTYNVTANWDNGCSATSNDISVNVITNCTTTYGDTNAVACGSFDWYEHTGIQTSGDYTHTFIGGNAVGCDSVVTLHLTVGHSNTGDTTAFACNSFDWYEHTGIQTSGDYTHTFIGGNAVGCDSVVTMHLTVGHSNTGDTTAFACNSFDWYEHHNITSSTNSLTHTFTNASGCDSVVNLHLTVGHSNTGDTTAFACNSFDWYEHHNITSSTSSLTHTFTNASGCDSVVTLHLTVGHSNTGDTTAFACDSFDWYEHTHITTSTNSLTHTFTNASGCDSVVTLHLTVGHSNTGDTTAFACNSFDWYEHTNITTSTNSLTHTFTNASGCDSVVTLHLTVGHSNTGDTTAFACNSFDWHEHHNITSSTSSLTHTFTNASGCDSTVTLHLTVGHSNTGDTTAFACNSFDWYEHTNITSSTNSLTHTFTNASGCDSVVTLHLAVGHSNTGDTTAFACGSFDWYEHKNITASTSSLTHTFTNANGCDSVVTLHLVINNAVNTDTTAEAVETFVWHRAGATDTTITTSGTYTYTHPDANGCVQTDTLHLTVYHATGTQIDTAACESFVWHRPLAGDTILTNSGTYIDNLTDVHGADSVITLVLNIKHGNFIPFSVAECDSYSWHDSTYTENGTYIFEYVNNVGCPSTDTLHLTINHAVNTDTTAEAVEAFVWHRAGAADTTITTSGTYTHAHPDANGCTQTDTLHLTVYHATGTQIDTAACESFVWQRPLAGDTTLLVSGIYYDTLTDVHGADSVITLVLNIKHGNFIPFSVAECDSYSWHDSTYTESGNYLFEYINNVGCPSTDTLHLTINHAVNTDTTAEAVETFVWHRAGAADTTITTSGTYTYTHPDANGCTQTDTLHLTVYHASGTQIDTATCESFVWHRPLVGDTTLLVSGIYYDTLSDVHGADSVITLVLNIKHGNFIPFSVAECDSYSWHDSTYTENGTYIFEYVNNVGCPSTDTLHLTINHTVNTDTTAEAVEAFVWHCAGAADTTITTSGTYTHAHPDANGCTQTDTLHLTVYHATNTQIDTSACEEFLWHRPLAGDTIITNSGTYIDNLTDVHGADSAVTLVLTIYSAEHTDLHVSICENELPYHYINGQIDTTFDVGTPSLLTVTYTLSTVNGCDSTVSLSITLFEVVNTDTVAEAVEAFIWHRAGAADTTITTSGTYTYTHPDANGCTQTDTLHLTVYHASGTQIDTATCESFVWHRPLAGDTILTNSGTYIDNLTDVHGADSVVTLVLTIYSTEHTDLNEYICQNELPYHYINGQIDTTFEVGTPSLLTVTYTLPTANGCDSTVTLNITLLEVVNTVAEAEAVEAFVWYRAGAADTTITSSGTYTHTHPNANGCTQTDTLHLTVYHATNTQIDTSACEVFLWHRPLAGDTIITNSGTYIDNFTDVHGADSVVTLVLTIYSTEHTDLHVSICENELPYHYISGQIDTTFEVGTPSLVTVPYTLSTANGCDSTVTLNLTVNPTYAIDTAVTITTNDLPYHFVSGQIDTTFEVGTPSQLSVPYTMSTVDGCDSTVTLHLTINVGIENHTAELLRAFPNPTTGHLTVIGSENLTQLQLFDTYGRRVGIYPVEGTQTEIDLHGLASGVYFLKAMREKQTAGTLKIIKNNE